MDGRYPFSSNEMNKYLSRVETILIDVINGEEPDHMFVLETLEKKKIGGLEPLLHEESQHQLEMKRQYLVQLAKDVLDCEIPTNIVAIGKEKSFKLDECHPCVTEMQERLKYLRAYKLKFVHNLIKPKEPKHDTSAERLFVECLEARTYRNEPVIYAAQGRNRRVITKPELEYLKHDPEFNFRKTKRAAKALFANDFSRRMFFTRYKKDFADLTPQEQKFYVEKWEGKHRKHIIELAQKVLRMDNWNPVPAYPLYVRYTDTNLLARVQSQTVERPEGEFTIDYFLNNTKKGTSWMNHQFQQKKMEQVVTGQYGKLFISIKHDSDQGSLLAPTMLESILGRYKGVMRNGLDTCKLFERLLFRPAEMRGCMITTYTDIDEINARLGEGWSLLEKDMRQWREGFTMWDKAFIRYYLDDFARKPEKPGTRSAEYKTLQVVQQHRKDRKIGNEIQIRSYPMHQVAEDGSASHEVYEEDKKVFIRESLRHHTKLSNGRLNDRFNEVMRYATAFISLETDPRGEEAICREYVEKKHTTGKMLLDYEQLKEELFASRLDDIVLNAQILQEHMTEFTELNAKDIVNANAFSECKSDFSKIVESYIESRGVNLLDYSAECNTIKKVFGITARGGLHLSHVKNIAALSTEMVESAEPEKMLIATLGTIVLQHYNAVFGSSLKVADIRKHGISPIRKSMYKKRSLYDMKNTGSGSVYMPKNLDQSYLAPESEMVSGMLREFGLNDAMFKAYMSAHKKLLSLLN